MTSKRHWSILIALLLIFSLLLVACVRPLPGDTETLPEEPPAEAYPAPAEAESEDASAEGYPAGEESAGGEADLLQPAEEGETAEAYPVVEGEAVEEEHAEAESAEGEQVEGEAADDEHAEGESAEGEHVEGEAAEDEQAEGETTEGEAAESEATEGETAESSPETEAVETGRTHTVAQGETLFRIGMQYGMSWVTLAQANDITNPNSLYPGQVLVIPDVETLEATDESTGETEEAASEETETGDADNLKTVYVGPEKVDCEGEGPQTCYLIKENLDDEWGLYYSEIDSFEYEPGYEYELLVSENEVENPPAGGSSLTWTLEEVVNKTAVDTEKAETKASAETEETTYFVQFGDTLYSISYQFGVSMMEIARANDLANFNQIYAGQELIIPQTETEEEAEAAVETAANEEAGATHVVQEGETVFTIAFKYSISWTELIEANEIASPYTLEVGQSLMIPSGK